MSEISTAELAFLLCFTCLSLATMLIWACRQIAPRLAVVRNKTLHRTRRR
jgi:hypothetical protein